MASEKTSISNATIIKVLLCIPVLMVVSFLLYFVFVIFPEYKEKPSISVEGTTIQQQEPTEIAGVYIEVTDLRVSEGSMPYFLNMKFSNSNSTDIEIVPPYEAYINGIKVMPFMETVTVPSGKTVEVSKAVRFSKKDIKDNDIKQFETISFKLYVCDAATSKEYGKGEITVRTNLAG